MAIVIDATIAIAKRLRDRDGTPFADAVVERIGTEETLVPDLFWHEVRSVLLVAERIGRIEVNATEYHMQAIRLLPLSTDGDFSDLALDHPPEQWTQHRQTKQRSGA